MRGVIGGVSEAYTTSGVAALAEVLIADIHP